MGWDRVVSGQRELAVAQSKSKREELKSQMLLGQERLVALGVWSLVGLECPIKLAQISISILGVGAEVEGVEKEKRRKGGKDWWVGERRKRGRWGWGNLYQKREGRG